jgi:hypothetical protein
MMSQQSKVHRDLLRRYLPHAFVATILIAIAPVVVVATMPPFTSLPWYLSVIAGMALSVGVTQASNLAWVKWFGTDDLVFSDLMLWGWIKRFRVERRIARVTAKLRVLENPSDSNALSIEAKTKILTDLVTSLEARDAYTHGHSRRVTRHAYMIAKAMGLPADQVERVRIAASVHDVGKLGIPLSIIRKPGKLTDEEFAQIAEHSVKGAELVTPLGDPLLTAIVRHHHERIDGSGYPDRLTGEEIPLGARIIAVADTFDAITSTRAYRKASPHSAALKIIRKEAGTQLDRDVVKAFLGYYSGRRSLEWWMVVTTLPQRAWAAIGGWGRSAVAMPAMQGIAAAGTAALVATSLGPAWRGPILPERSSDRSVTAVAEAFDEENTNPSSEYSHGIGAQGRGVNGPNHKGKGHGKGKSNKGGNGKGNKGGNGKGKPADHPESQGGTSGGGASNAAVAKPEKPEKAAKDDGAVVVETPETVTEEVTEEVAAPAPAPAAPAEGNGPPDKPEKPTKPSKGAR